MSDSTPARFDLRSILEAARWAPSGDNTQPWRFEVHGPDRATVHCRDARRTDIYDFDSGRPSLLSFGMLLENMRVAASQYRHSIQWSYYGAPGRCDHRLDIAFNRHPDVRPSYLNDAVQTRSVDRRRYRMTPLLDTQRAQLEASVGPYLRIRWLQGLGARLQAARVVALSTDIRLRSRAAFDVHQKVLAWNETHSADKMPAATLPVDPLTRRLMRWLMHDWSRMAWMNRIAGTSLAQLEMDYLPGIFSGAHFIITAGDRQLPRTEPEGIVRAGQHLQRLWLTATAAGLSLQPTMAPLIFAHRAMHPEGFTLAPPLKQKSHKLHARLERLAGVDPSRIVFMGRIGIPRRPQKARSVRRPLEALMVCGPTTRRAGLEPAGHPGRMAG